MRDLILFVLVCAVIYGLYLVGTDPYRTTLPMDVADLSPIQPALDKLPPKDRELVTDYLKRSNGDVLPVTCRLSSDEELVEDSTRGWV